MTPIPGRFEVEDLIGESQGDLVGGFAQRHVVANERPGEDRHRTGEHALDSPRRLLGGVSRPFHGDRIRAGHIAEENRGTGASGSIGLHPPVVGGREAVEVLGEVLDHVIAFGFAVDDDIESQFLLQTDDSVDLVLHQRGVVGIVDAARPVICTGAAHLGRLRERTDGRRRQLGDPKRLLSRMTRCEIGAEAGVCRSRLGAGQNRIVVDSSRFGPGAPGPVGAFECRCTRLGSLGDRRGESLDLGDLLLGE